MECKRCKKDFVKKFSFHKFCCSYCRGMFFYERNKKIIKKICLICKKEFIGRKNAIYCCKKCRRRAESNRRKPSRKHEIRKCLICGKKYTEKIRWQKYCSIECQYIANKPGRRKFNIQKRKTNVNYKLRHNISNRIILALRAGEGYKSIKTLELIGCSIKELKLHLENKFIEGMNWENYGKWEIDHIKPCCKFDLTNIEEQKKCFNYNNLQPLWRKENLKKGAKWKQN